MAKNGKIAIFDHTSNARIFLTVQGRVIFFGSIPRFWGSTNTAFFAKSFYRVRLKSYGRNAEIGKFLNSEAIFAKFQMSVKC